MLDLLLTDARLATMDLAVAGPFGAVESGAVGIRKGRIAYVGPAASAPPAPRVEFLAGRWVTPALIDCHTHLVFAGNRAREFDARQNGATYEEIARAGGGILSTVRATREATLEALVESAIVRLEALRRGGVATVEIKSGYGLTPGDEEKMLIAAGEAARAARMRVKRTLLALHALPPEHEAERAAYVRLVCERMIPGVAAAGLADAVDAFCETIGFTLEETRAVFDAAAKHGLRVKLHAEQLSDMKGAALAAAYGALSADHLEHIDEAGVVALAKAKTVAVLLPGAFYALRETRKPPVADFRKHGVAMALATDLNPGTSPMLSPSLALSMGATLFGMTPEECLAGMTRNAARALGLDRECGVLKVGLAADIAVWPVDHPAELSYWIGHPGPDSLYIAGVAVEEH